MMRIVFLFPVIFLMGCQTEELPPTDQLEESGLLGRWEIQSRTINGITSLEAFCCEFLEFALDSGPLDLKGEFISQSSGTPTEGTFTLDKSNGTILFEFNEKQQLFEYELRENLLALRYEDTGTPIEEDWRRVE